MVAGDPEKIISANQDERQDQARGAAATSRTDANRHAEQGENKTSGGKRETILKFDAGVAPIRAVIGEKRRNGLFGDA